MTHRFFGGGLRPASTCAILLIAWSAFGQGDFAPPPSKDDPLQLQNLKALPAGVILVPGAVPSASDSRTAVPESGSIRKHVYENAYFGMRYEFPEAWRQEFSGPPPSDSGEYVLANLTAGKASILVTAQDSFFAPPKTSLPSYYKLDSEPADIRVGEAAFTWFSYSSPSAGLHWYVFSTPIRCHSVQFVFTSQDTKLLDELVANLKQIGLSNNDAPKCIADYAPMSRIEPAFSDNKFNPIPARIIIGKNGRVRHVHILSAFSDQAEIVTDALMQWRFKPAETEIETGIVFRSSSSRNGGGD
jgi:hypothetical protein